MPPTGVRVTCTIFERFEDRAWSEPAFGDFDGVAGAERIAQRQREAGRRALHLAGDGDLVLGRRAA